MQSGKFVRDKFEIGRCLREGEEFEQLGELAEGRAGCA